MKNKSIAITAIWAAVAVIGCREPGAGIAVAFFALLATMFMAD